MIDSWLRGIAGGRGGMSNLIVRATFGRSAGREGRVSIRTCPMRTWTFLKPLPIGNTKFFIFLGWFDECVMYCIERYVHLSGVEVLTLPRLSRACAVVR